MAEVTSSARVQRVGRLFDQLAAGIRGVDGDKVDMVFTVDDGGMLKSAQIGDVVPSTHGDTLVFTEDGPSGKIIERLNQAGALHDGNGGITNYRLNDFLSILQDAIGMTRGDRPRAAES